MKKVAIVGATGYTGCEILDILLSHRMVEVTSLTAKVEKSLPLHAEFPRFAGRIGLLCTPPDIEEICEKADLVFLALPHGISMQYARAFLEEGKEVVDLSADFRLADPEEYRTWYAREHVEGALLSEAVYGLPELYGDVIREARLIANPGCYPTGAILALVPLLHEKVVDHAHIIVDAKSGVTGAGRKASLPLCFAECNESFRAYKIGAHQHTPEIEEQLGKVCGASLKITFVPHLVPMNRGIITTAYLDPVKEGIDDGMLRELYAAFYKDAPFVRIMPAGTLPDTRNVTGMNYCDIAVTYEKRTGRIIVVSAIDNLVKGAAGQAVQNMNLMCGFPETEGLR